MKISHGVRLVRYRNEFGKGLAGAKFLVFLLAVRAGDEGVTEYLEHRMAFTWPEKLHSSRQELLSEKTCRFREG